MKDIFLVSIIHVVEHSFVADELIKEFEAHDVAKPVFTLYVRAEIYSS